MWLQFLQLLAFAVQLREQFQMQMSPQHEALNAAILLTQLLNACRHNLCMQDDGMLIGCSMFATMAM